MGRSMSAFLLGVNYWPRRSAMYMWQRFDLGEIREDFARIAGLGIRAVRFFLSWEAFQPQRDTVDRTALKRFDAVMQALSDANLLGMPTLFCGHMSGVNWLPAWTLDARTSHGRFRTISGGVVSPRGIGDFYANDGLMRAQLQLAWAIGERARRHPSLLAWDIGNEFSNMREPASPLEAATWSLMLTEVLEQATGADVTGGIHGEDVTRDRNLRPSSIAYPWSFATMHGYPVYSSFAHANDDPEVVPFLAMLTESLTHKRVLFSELGNPTCLNGAQRAGAFACLTEDEMARYAYAVLDRLQRRGAIGAFWWCFADYDERLRELAPFDRAPHELTFGIVRSDGTEKPVARAIERFARESRRVAEPAHVEPIDETAFYASLPNGLDDVYRRYCRLVGA